MQAAADGKTGKVFRVVGGRLQAATIGLGPQSSGQQVLSGLGDGDALAAENLDKLRDGMKAGGS